MKASRFSSSVKSAKVWLLAYICILTASGLVLGAAAQKITVLLPPGKGLFTLDMLAQQVRAHGRECYVDRRLANIRLVVPPGPHDADALLRATALSTRLEVRRVGSITHIGLLTNEKMDAKETAELDRALSQTFNNLLAAESERLQQEGIPFEISDFISRRQFTFNQLSARQKEFVQQMFLRQKAWEEYLASKIPRRPGQGFSFQKHYEPKPHEDLSKLSDVAVFLLPAYDVGIQTYHLESLIGSDEIKYRPFSWTSLTFE